MKSRLKAAGKMALRRLFELGQRLGLDVLPRHFYSEIPDIAELKKDRGWMRAYTMKGVAGAGLGEQLDFVRSCTQGLAETLEARDIHAQACRENGAPGFGPVEADFLYCFMRRMKPAKVLQIGCGVSTSVMLRAAKDEGYATRISCVDPYPTDFVIQAAQQGLITLVRERAERLDIAFLSGLGEGELLFVDSTHALKPGGEVPRIILEALPRLNVGAWAHFHDIYFPYDYARGILRSDLFFPHESVLLHAYLTDNPRAAIAASLSLLHYGAPQQLKALLPGYRPAANNEGLGMNDGDFPSSLYIRITR